MNQKNIEIHDNCLNFQKNINLTFDDKIFLNYI